MQINTKSCIGSSLQEHVLSLGFMTYQDPSTSILPHVPREEFDKEEMKLFECTYWIATGAFGLCAVSPLMSKISLTYMTSIILI